jgi:hypothetical protein
VSTKFTVTVTTPFAVTAGTQYAVIIGDTVAAAKTTALRSFSTDTYPGTNNVAFNASGSLSPVDLYFEYTTSAPDYIASDATTQIWDKDKTGASTHNLGIAAIGRDDVSGLVQLKSKPQVVTGSPIIEASSANVADLEFLSWGGDSGALGVQQSELPGSGLPTYTNSRLIREWQVQKVGDVGTVSVSLDLAEHSIGATDMTKVRLLIDADADFSTGASISSITPTISGTTITFAGVAFTDGQYFTIALPFNAKSPG